MKSFHILKLETKYQTYLLQLNRLKYIELYLTKKFISWHVNAYRLKY